MMDLGVASDFARAVSHIKSHSGLKDALAQACDQAGLNLFALSHHVDFASSPKSLRIHNYPDWWQDWYDANHLGPSDPIHRASHVTLQGFLWRDLPGMITLTRGDIELLRRGREMGLGEGVTVPAHIPGEARGSCTFVAAPGIELHEDVLPWAQLIGIFAFEGLRRLQPRPHAPLARISDRQRECIMLAGRGLHDNQIAHRLGIKEHTVIQHFRDARVRLGGHTRTELVLRLIADGGLCLDDVVKFPR